MAIGYRFTEYIPPQDDKPSFESLLKIFLQLVTISSGDVGEALNWLSSLDKQYNITSDDYGIGDFIEDLRKKGYLDEDKEKGTLQLTAKSEQGIRRSALEEIFGKLKKGGKGGHATPHTGTGDEASTDRREYRFGDALEERQTPRDASKESG